jgi:quercetin dioxygenase-like cupin family protein
VNKPKPVVTRDASEGRTIGIVGDIYRFLATGEETDGRYTMIEATVNPDCGPPPHIHRREDEWFYVVEGEITFQIGEERRVAKPGTLFTCRLEISMRLPTTQTTRFMVLLPVHDWDIIQIKVVFRSRPSSKPAGWRPACRGLDRPRPAGFGTFQPANPVACTRQKPCL